MDPVGILNEAQELLRVGGCRGGCAERLIDYYQWRLKGGFEPTGGDGVARRLLRDLGRTADTLSAALVGEAPCR